MSDSCLLSDKKRSEIFRSVQSDSDRFLKAQSIDSVHPLFRMKKLIAVPLLIVVVLLTYAPSMRNDFVWDDTALILRDPLIRSWRLIPEGFNHFLFTDATPSNFYRPVQRLVYT